MELQPHGGNTPWPDPSCVPSKGKDRTPPSPRNRPKSKGRMHMKSLVCSLFAKQATRARERNGAEIMGTFKGKHYSHQWKQTADKSNQCQKWMKWAGGVLLWLAVTGMHYFVQRCTAEWRRHSPWSIVLEQHVAGRLFKQPPPAASPPYAPAPCVRGPSCSPCPSHCAAAPPAPPACRGVSEGA